MAGYLEALPTGPPWTPVPPATRAALRDQELADGGTPFEELIAFVEDNVLPHPFGNGHPRFFGWANPPPALEGVLAELVATAMNPSCAGGDQAAVHLENLVVGWLAQLIGYPGGGVLVSGGSAGALTALAAARHRAALADGWDDRVEGMGGKRAADLRLYVSSRPCFRPRCSSRDRRRLRSKPSHREERRLLPDPLRVARVAAPR
jgi:glutamate/tyrosine decarboxylase-like PLP-dependent enzyme